MRRALIAGLLAALLIAPSAKGAEWHSETPVAPGTGVPQPLGQVGDIEFWAPNRGVLITAGVGGMPRGVYAYDGTGWHLYSTVCGGREGRIAWAGPTEFWTISEQPRGQETIAFEPAQQVSLCHFKGGQVVASYAEPREQTSSYLKMNAAACSGPDDCWFAGERLPGTVNSGAFHLHWDGQTVRPVPSLTDVEELADPGRTVRDLVAHQGRFYESVQVQAGDIQVPLEEAANEPSFLHRVDAGAPTPFEPLFPGSQLAFGSADPTQLGAFRLSSVGDRLWGIAGASGGGTAVTPALVTIAGDGLAQVPVSSGTFQPGDHVGGLAIEPGSDSAWVTFAHAGEFTGGSPVASAPGAVARVARVHADGSVGEEAQLPAPAEGLSRKGIAGPIVCPALEQCWMATRRGWLFHLGGSLPPDADPAMHALITSRPPDNSTPPIPPVELPFDDSGSESADMAALEQPSDQRRRQPRPRQLVTKVRQKMLDNVLQLSFTLRTRALVRLRAKREGKVVAQTPRLTLGKGPHRLRLRLDPERWPTSLDFDVHRARGGAGS